MGTRGTSLKSVICLDIHISSFPIILLQPLVQPMPFCEIFEDWRFLSISSPSLSLYFFLPPLPLSLILPLFIYPSSHLFLSSYPGLCNRSTCQILFPFFHITRVSNMSLSLSFFLVICLLTANMLRRRQLLLS